VTHACGPCRPWCITSAPCAIDRADSSETAEQERRPADVERVPDEQVSAAGRGSTLDVTSQVDTVARRSSGSPSTGEDRMLQQDEAEHVTANREHWDRIAAEWVAAGEREWAADAITWGIWGVPESEIGLLGHGTDDLAGLDVVELGCGTAYLSAWLARRGARVTGVDVSSQQLATARRLTTEHGLTITLVEGDAEATGLAASSFDLVVSEYGASLWCDPGRWLAEAARLLRPGGRLAFLTSSRFVPLASPVDGSLPVTERFERPWFGPSRFDWRDAVDLPGGIEFVLSAPEWIRALGAAGFEVVHHEEIAAPADADGTRSGIPAGWAQRWPSEQTWGAVRR
jgi:ubiquinone/menaquinone biosynthesis C-methylase UbiE